MDTDNTPDGDFLTVLSSELIAEVMEEYFNRKMYRQKVKVVDLQPQGSGYAFSLAFVKDNVKTYKLDIDTNNNGSWVPVHPNMDELNRRMTARDGAILDRMAQEALESATNVDYTMPQTRDTKGKFTKKVKAHG